MASKPQPPFPPQDLEQPGLESRMDPQPRYEADSYRPAGKLEGKAALVTGGDSGIGRAVAVIFAREGADVGLVYLEQEQLDAEQTREEVEACGREALLIPGDVRNPDFCRDAVEQVVQQFGRLDVLVNNAAYQKHRQSLDEISEDQWEQTFRTNIFGYFYMARFAVPHMKPGGYVTGHVLPQLGGETVAG